MASIPKKTLTIGKCSLISFFPTEMEATSSPESNSSWSIFSIQRRNCFRYLALSTWFPTKSINCRSPVWLGGTNTIVTLLFSPWSMTSRLQWVHQTSQVDWFFASVDETCQGRQVSVVWRQLMIRVDKRFSGKKSYLRTRDELFTMKRTTDDLPLLAHLKRHANIMPNSIKRRGSYLINGVKPFSCVEDRNKLAEKWDQHTVHPDERWEREMGDQS